MLVTKSKMTMGTHLLRSKHVSNRQPKFGLCCLHFMDATSSAFGFRVWVEGGSHLNHHCDWVSFDAANTHRTHADAQGAEGGREHINAVGVFLVESISWMDDLEDPLGWAC